jgi:hypothetical protein
VTTKVDQHGADVETNMTAGMVLSQAALQVGVAGDDKMTGEEKVRLFNLAMTVAGAKNGEIDLPVEDVAYIKTRIGKMFPPLIVGRMEQILK